MTRVTLITPTPPDISAFGLRAVSAYLRRSGIDARCVFLPGGIEKLRHGRTVEYRYSDTVMDRIAGLTTDDVITGISFMSQYRDRAIQLTQMLKSGTKSLVVWGGIHTQANTADALEYADAACIGEGETVMADLIGRLESGRGIGDVPGLWVHENGRIAENPCPPLIEDLDGLPPVDFSCRNHYLLDPIQDRIIDLTDDVLERVLPLMPGRGGKPLRVYRTMTSRGCPHRCTYCANRIQASRYPGKNFLRFRSPDHIMTELKDVTSRFPFIEGIHFFDDVFTAMPRRDLETLCVRFNKEIGLPYYAQISPGIIDRPMLEMMLDTGLVFLDMGIQTGSRSTRDIYQRPETNEQILSAAKLIHEFRDRLLTPHYHVILDNPWESREDLRQTLNLLLKIPGRFKLCLSSLTFYPGTELYERAGSEGLIRDETRDIYQKPFYIPKGRYLNYLVYLADIAWIPRGLIRWLGGTPAGLFDRPAFGGVFDAARRITDLLRLAGKGAGAVFRGEWRRILRYFKRVK